MTKPVVQRLVLTAFALVGCAPGAGCLTGGANSASEPGSGKTNRSHSERADRGGSASPAGEVARLALRPEACTVPAGGTQVFIATLYDDAGTPCPDREVEWAVEGSGAIVEVNEDPRATPPAGTHRAGSAVSRTAASEHHLIRGGTEFTIGPGQTWCMVTSPAAGMMTVTAHVPAGDRGRGLRAVAKARSVTGGAQWPSPVTARAGSECTLRTRVTPASDVAAGYRVRYRIVDGPPAALSTPGRGAVDSVTEGLAAVGDDGVASIRISQPAPASGANRIAVELLRPSPQESSGYAVVSTGETTVTWQASAATVAISAPKALAMNREARVTYSVGGADDGAATVVATVPPGLEVVRTEPEAVREGDRLVWEFRRPGSPAPRTVTAIYRAVRPGSAPLGADARTSDGQVAHGSASVQVTEAKLLVKVEGPRTGLVAETLPFKVIVTNVGDGAADQVRVRARLDDGGDPAAKSVVLDETAGVLDGGQSKTFSLPISPRRPGGLTLAATASAAGGLIALPEMASVTVQEPELTVSVHGPGRGYVGQELTWKLVVRNVGDVPLRGVEAKVDLPAEVRFVKATHGGRSSGKQVVWDLGTAPPRQERTVEVTAVCERLTDRAAVRATASASPATESAGANRPGTRARRVGPDRPVEIPFEVTGVPALQLSVKDGKDPVAPGERTTYVVRVRNAGTVAARKVEVTGQVPANLAPVRATGPGPAGQINGQNVTFTPIDALAPNAEASFVIEVEGRLPGEGRFRAEVRSALLAQPLRAEEPTRVLGRESPPSGR